jgi:hypothetical protein
MDCGIRLTVDYYDDDVVGLVISASNGRFSGVAAVVESLRFAKDLAETLAGFPTRPGDHRAVELGTFDPAGAGGGVRLTFRTVGGAGHPAVEVSVRADPHRGAPEVASLVIDLEAARIDDFVAALDHLTLERGATATLVSSP